MTTAFNTEIARRKAQNLFFSFTRLPILPYGFIKTCVLQIFYNSLILMKTLQS